MVNFNSTNTSKQYILYKKRTEQKNKMVFIQENFVQSFVHLKEFPDEHKALDTLKRVASLVKPYVSTQMISQYKEKRICLLRDIVMILTKN